MGRSEHQTLSSGVWWQDQGRWGQPEIQEIPFKHRYNLFSHVVSQTLDEVACRVRGVFILGHIQRAPEGVPGPSALPDPALSRGLGLGGARGVCSLSDP